MSIYRDHILDHYKNPRNSGKLSDFTHYSGKVNNPLCGDEVEVWVDVFPLLRQEGVRGRYEEENDAVKLSSDLTPTLSYLEERGRDDDGSPLAAPRPCDRKRGREGVLQAVGFDGHGCAICIASASLLTEWAKGKTIQEIEQMTTETVVALLGIPLTPVRLKCALLPRDALRKALEIGTV